MCQVLNLPVNLQADFDKAPFKNWMVSGRLAGSVKSGAGLTFIEVENAGHMVPLNQPEVVSGLLERGGGGGVC